MHAGHKASASLDEAQVEHDSKKVLIAELIEGKPDDDYYDAKVAVLREQVQRDDDRDGRGRSRGEYGRFESDDRGGSGRYSRSRDDDDDRDRGRGWFGDLRGHAEAARRGWQDR